MSEGNPKDINFKPIFEVVTKNIFKKTEPKLLSLLSFKFVALSYVNERSIYSVTTASISPFQLADPNSFLSLKLLA